MIGAVTALAAGGAVARQAAAPVPAAAQGARALPATQKLFEDYVASGKVPGIVAAFGSGDAPPVFVGAGRIADAAGAPAAGPDTLWRIYSMTKPVTGIAAMLLVEDGKIRLDDPLSNFFPAYSNMRVLTQPDTSLDSVPAERPITIRMLMTHTSGLGYSINAKGPLLREYERLGLVPATVNAGVEARLRQTRPATLAAFAERAAQAPLVYQPGTRWHYSIGLDVLGAVIEKASGMPFEAFLKRRLFDPLGMRSTAFQVAAADAGRLSTNYAVALGRLAPLDPAETSPFRQPPSFPYGGAGLVSSARDYDRFLHMLQNGGTLDGVRVMKAETARLALSNLLPAGVSFREQGGSTSGAPDGTALGFGAGGFVTLVDTPVLGRGSYGWSGAANTMAWVDPGRARRGAVMVNFFPYGAYPLRAEIGRALAQDVAGAGAR